MSRPHKAETGLQGSIVDALTHERDLVLWRNANGVYRGYGGRVRAGLPKGSADLVGVLSITVDVHNFLGHPGHGPVRFGIFVALEIKRPGEVPEEHQVAWLADVRARGGFAAIVHSIDEARAAIAAARAGASTWEAPPAPPPPPKAPRAGKARRAAAA